MKKNWLKICLVILTFAAISSALYFICQAFGISNISNLRTIITKSGNFSIIMYVTVLVIVLVFFCFVPFLNTTLTILGVVLFGAKIAFATNIISIVISTTILFFIGDKLGEKFAIKLIGEKSLVETQNLIDRKSKIWLPILFILPGIPDEALCLVAGMTKMPYWYVLLVSVLYHLFEIGLCCFLGSGLISWSTLSTFDWIVLGNLVLIDIYLLVKFEKYLEKRTKKQ